MKKFVFFLLFSFLLLSCERYNFDDDSSVISRDGVSVTFKVSEIEQQPFESTNIGRSVNSLSSLCSRITIAIFKGDDKVKTINQQSETEGFGSFSVELEPAEYRLVVIAHNGTANATISLPEKITFPSNKCTDTFYNYSVFSVEEDTEISLSLKRCVAAVKISLLDNIPEDVAKMKFYYTGGSSTFDAVSGHGCVNSRQTEVFDVTESMHAAPSFFQVYTFPHEVSGNLKFTISALDGSDNVVQEKVFSSLPVSINKVSVWEGIFFPSTYDLHSTSANLFVENDGKWDGQIIIE